MTLVASVAALMSAQQCVPAGGPPPSMEQCGIYWEFQDWVPNSYAGNAECACLKTPDGPEANCVRAEVLAGLSSMPSAVVDEGARLKAKYGFFAFVNYERWVLFEFSPIIYEVHYDAYRRCCCPSGPAWEWAFSAVSLAPMTCGAVGTAIDWFGSCHGTPGAW